MNEKPKKRRIIQMMEGTVIDHTNQDGYRVASARRTIFLLTDDGKVWQRNFDAERQQYTTHWFPLWCDVETQ